jgi:hypothetical protein
MSARFPLSPRRRLALAIGLIGLVHVLLLFVGNEDATPGKLAGSFAVSTALLVVSFQIKRQLTAAAGSTPATRDPQ